MPSQTNLFWAFSLMVLTIVLTAWATWRMRELCLDYQVYLTTARITELTLSTGYAAAIAAAAVITFSCQAMATPWLRATRIVALCSLVTAGLLMGYVYGAIRLLYSMFRMSESLN